MLIVETSTASKILEKIAENLDIPEWKYLQAEQRYNNLAKHLSTNIEEELDIYVQGSFMLGTVVRPCKNGLDADYDIDLVCQLKKEHLHTDAKEIKHTIGEVLKNGLYSEKLDNEGKRCWTLNYSEEDGVGFHMDCLPCAMNGHSFGRTCIALTHKAAEHNYEWRYSNPKGLDIWFKDKQKGAFERIVLNAKQRIYENSTRGVYGSIEEVPNRMVKTPLQKVIQVLKRHRDVYFAGKQNEENKPISMIITILSAQLYSQELDTFEALKNISKAFTGYSRLLRGEKIDDELLLKGLISFDGKEWKILNPVEEENFAEFWHKNNHAKAKAFFEWAAQVEKDLVRPLESGDIDKLRPMYENSLRQTFNRSFLENLGLEKAEQKHFNENVVPRKRVEISNPIKPHWWPNEK